MKRLPMILLAAEYPEDDLPRDVGGHLPDLHICGNTSAILSDMIVCPAAFTPHLPQVSS